jgi:bile acid-coenzyme A ligase
MGTDVRILDETGEALPTGEIGQIYMKSEHGILATYVGDVPPIPVTEDGYSTVGDLGWLDSDGYLYIADRRVDMIVTGGANVYPAEVEAALSEHPSVADVVVIGLSDPEWGRRVHAIVQLEKDVIGLSADELIDYAGDRLARYKTPKSVELVTEIPRSEATKVNRSALVAAREVAEE